MPKPKAITPFALILDEGKLVEQRANWGVLGLEETNIPPVWNKTWKHFKRIYLGADDFANRSEFLARCWLLEYFLWGVINDPVAHGHAFKRLSLAVAKLTKPASNTTADMIF